MNPRKLAALVAAGLVLVTAISAVSAVAVDRGPRTHADVNLIRVVGQEDFEQNALVFSTFRFDPERSFPHQGERVRLLDADRSTGAPHTLTIVRRGQLPTSFDELFACPACQRALDAHFATDPPTARVGLTDGLNAPGDSMLIFEGQAIGAQVTAPAGSVMSFVCAFHPWMQGRLVVG